MQLLKKKEFQNVENIVENNLNDLLTRVVSVENKMKILEDNFTVHAN